MWTVGTLKLRRESKERRRNVAYFTGTLVVTVPAPIQLTTGFSARSEKYGSMKGVAMKLF
jgi:hypothetical protein